LQQHDVLEVKLFPC